MMSCNDLLLFVSLPPHPHPVPSGKCILSNSTEFFSVVVPLVVAAYRVAMDIVRTWLEVAWLILTGTFPQPHLLMMS